MKRLVLLAALVLVPIASRAQTAPTAPSAAPAPADTALARYAGPWAVTIPDTPAGTLEGTLTVGADGTGTLALPGLDVKDAAVTGVHVMGGALMGATTFYSSVAGGQFVCTMTLAPAEGGTLAGTITAEGDATYAMTARRPNG